MESKGAGRPLSKGGPSLSVPFDRVSVANPGLLAMLLGGDTSEEERESEEDEDDEGPVRFDTEEYPEYDSVAGSPSHSSVASASPTRARARAYNEARAMAGIADDSDEEAGSCSLAEAFASAKINAAAVAMKGGADEAGDAVPTKHEPLLKPHRVDVSNPALLADLLVGDQVDGTLAGGRAVCNAPRLSRDAVGRSAAPKRLHNSRFALKLRKTRQMDMMYSPRQDSPGGQRLPKSVK